MRCYHSPGLIAAAALCALWAATACAAGEGTPGLAPFFQRTGTPQPGPTSRAATVEAGPSLSDAEQANFARRRKRMVAEQMRASSSGDRRADITDARVLQAMETVPRHRFVPIEYLDEAYADHPLPIGYGQTISQPYIVALMTASLAIQPGDKVLEIGTGSGYQAAVLAELTDQVFTVEILEPLARTALARLRELGYRQVQVKIGDGYFGWEEQAPFDAIIVTAAPDHIPQPLIRQLKDGGRLLIPVGPPGGYQTLWKIVKRGDRLTNVNLGGVQFVPLVRESRAD